MLQVADAPAGTSYVQLLEPLARIPRSGASSTARRGHASRRLRRDRHHSRAGGDRRHRDLRLIDSRPRHGSMGASIAFLHPADVGGVLTELVQSAGQTARAASKRATDSLVRSSARIARRDRTGGQPLASGGVRCVRHRASELARPGSGLGRAVRDAGPNCGTQGHRPGSAPSQSCNPPVYTGLGDMQPDIDAQLSNFFEETPQRDFARVMRGYDPHQVNEHLKQLDERAAAAPRPGPGAA